MKIFTFAPAHRMPNRSVLLYSDSQVMEMVTANVLKRIAMSVRRTGSPGETNELMKRMDFMAAVVDLTSKGAEDERILDMIEANDPLLGVMRITEGDTGDGNTVDDGAVHFDTGGSLREFTEKIFDCCMITFNRSDGWLWKGCRPGAADIHEKETGR